MNAKAVAQVAAELGVDIAPPATKRVTRKRTPNRNGPVERTVLWSAVIPRAKAEALLLAGGDVRRCKPIKSNEVVVLNQPGKEPPR